MRYVKLRTTISKVADEHIDDIKTIRSIVSVLKEKEIDCVLQLSGGPRLTRIRIRNVSDDTFGFQMRSKNSSLTKTVPYSEIDYLEINTSADIINRTKPGVSRWLLLDPATDESESV